MKTQNFFALLLILLISVSCKSDDDNPVQEFFPKNIVVENIASPQFNTTIEIGYNSDNMLTSMTSTHTDGTIISNYTYNDQGDITLIQTIDNIRGLIFNYKFTYTNNRITSFTASQGTEPDFATYTSTYDQTSNTYTLTGFDTLRFSFDEENNLISEVKEGNYEKQLFTSSATGIFKVIVAQPAFFMAESLGDYLVADHSTLFLSNKTITREQFVDTFGTPVELNYQYINTTDNSGNITNVSIVQQETNEQRFNIDISYERRNLNP